MAITPLPTPPSRLQAPNVFNAAADSFLASLPRFATEANALAADTNTQANSAIVAASNASVSAGAATAAASAAESSANVLAWTSGGFYSLGAVVYSSVDFLAYRHKVSGTSTLDPSTDSTGWARISGVAALPLAGGNMSGSIGMGGNQINNLGTPINADQPATKGYSDNAYLFKTGGAVTGIINMGNNIIANLGSPTAPDHAANKFYVDSNYFPRSGGTVSGNIIINGTRVSVANSSIAMSELHIPGQVAWGMFLSTGSGFLRWTTTDGGGTVVSEKMTLGPNGELWTSQIGDVFSSLQSKTVPGRTSTHATGVAEFGAVNLGVDNTVDCPAPYVMVGLRTVGGATGTIAIRGVQLKST